MRACIWVYMSMFDSFRGEGRQHFCVFCEEFCNQTTELLLFSMAKRGFADLNREGQGNHPWREMWSNTVQLTMMPPKTPTKALMMMMMMMMMIMMMQLIHPQNIFYQSVQNALSTRRPNLWVAIVVCSPGDRQVPVPRVQTCENRVLNICI